MRYYKRKINECDCGGVCAPVQTINNTTGIGNPTPPQIAATTGAEMTDLRCIGSGDKFGSSSKPNKKRKPKFKRKKKINEGFSNIFDSSGVDYASHFEKSDINYKKEQIENFIFKYIKYYNPEYYRRFNIGKKDQNIIYSIDSDYNVHLINKYNKILVFFIELDKNILELPVSIVECNGSLCADNNNLISLKGFPKKINGVFSVNNNKLKNLEYGPEEVNQLYSVERNKLISLIGAPKIINHTDSNPKSVPVLRLTTNPKLKSNEGLPDNINYRIEYPLGFYRANKDKDPNIQTKGYIDSNEIEKN